MLRCSKCGSGMVQWSAGQKWVMECRVCLIQWIVNSEELSDWAAERGQTFTNMDEL